MAAILLVAAIGFILYLLFGYRATSCLFRSAGLFAFFVLLIMLWGILTFGKTPPP